MARHISMIVMLAVAAFLGLSFMMSSRVRTDSVPQVFTPPPNGGKAAPAAAVSDSKMAGIDLSSSFISGGAIAPKLENATIKAELGRASWKLLHTMMARFPEKPTEDDSLALKTYMQLFSRLYPCGDCARHFQGLLKKYPPQVSSRNAAAGWACFMHNQVNERLHKPLFDCNNIGDFYDCGCGDEDKDKGKEGKDKKKEGAATELKLEKDS
ncbi:FAD-linked sulfhydryl oxidase ERV2 [Apiospora rasikravindrae]|uniref:Sulfhydryl oxidase n=1 Tax=Apiospora rasikravindrae TaxID=990691 RepID=A0ABR1U9W8_9PEZI